MTKFNTQFFKILLFTNNLQYILPFKKNLNRNNMGLK